MGSFGVIWIKITGTSTEGTDEPLTKVVSSVSLMHHDLSDLGLPILSRLLQMIASLIAKWFVVVVVILL